MIGLRRGVGDHPAERMAQHELEAHFESLREQNRCVRVHEIMSGALAAALKARQ
jgi:hypothetical protein